MRALGARCCCHPHCRPYHWHSTLPGGILRAGPLTCAANREASAPPNVLVKCMETRHERGTRRGTFRFSLGSALISTLSRTGCVLACWLCRTRGATELPSCAVRSAQRTAALPSFEAAVTEPALRAALTPPMGFQRRRRNKADAAGEVRATQRGNAKAAPRCSLCFAQPPGGRARCARQRGEPHAPASRGVTGTPIHEGHMRTRTPGG